VRKRWKQGDLCTLKSEDSKLFFNLNMIDGGEGGRFVGFLMIRDQKTGPPFKLADKKRIKIYVTYSALL
jgi:hypothetical protein